MKNTLVRHFIEEMNDKFVVRLEKQLLQERAERVYRRALLFVFLS
jgi:hypothetical protein